MHGIVCKLFYVQHNPACEWNSNPALCDTWTYRTSGHCRLHLVVSSRLKTQSGNKPKALLCHPLSFSHSTPNRLQVYTQRRWSSSRCCVVPINRQMNYTMLYLAQLLLGVSIMHHLLFCERVDAFVVLRAYWDIPQCKMHLYDLEIC